MKALTLFMSFILMSSLSQAKVWEGRHDWNEEWEVQYTEWISKVSEDAEFFRKRNILIDCADAAYGFRWIFSRIHDLKAAIKVDHKNFITNETDLFDQLPTATEWDQDKRFLRALSYINTNYSKAKYTYMNAYPVELSKASLTAGTLFVASVLREHVQIISNAYAEVDRLPISFIQATTPTSLQALTRVDYWAGAQPLDQTEGFMKFRWPIKQNGKWLFVPDEKMPFYSKAQYNPNLLDNWVLPFAKKYAEDEEAIPTFGAYVFYTLNPQLDPQAVITRGLTEIESKFKQRRDLVNAGHQYCRVDRSECPKDSQDYDDWSTPSRDQQLQDLIQRVALDVGNVRFFIKNPQTQWNSFMYNTKFGEWNGKQIRLLHLFVIWHNQLYSSDPNASVEERWGFNKLDFENYKPK